MKDQIITLLIEKFSQHFQEKPADKALDFCTQDASVMVIDAMLFGARYHELLIHEGRVASPENLFQVQDQFAYLHKVWLEQVEMEASIETL